MAKEEKSITKEAMENSMNNNNIGLEDVTEKVSNYVSMILPEDIEINQEISDTATRLLNEYFIIDLEDIPMIPIVIYNIVYNTMIEELVVKRDKHDEYVINVCGLFKIGFTNQFNEDNEKNGNFTPHIESIDHIFSFEHTPTINDTAKNIGTLWCATNMVESNEILSTIGVKALNKLTKEFDINLGGIEILYPIFCTTHDTMEHILKLKLNEYSSEYVPTENDNYDGNMFEINFAGCYRVGSAIIEDENGEPDYTNPQIVFTPAVFNKTAIKSDIKGTSKFE